MSNTPLPTPHHVYLLGSERSRTAWYVGYTVDVEQRLVEHNTSDSAGAWATRDNRPWNVLSVVSGFLTESAAKQFEWAAQHTKSSTSSLSFETSVQSILRRVLDEVVMDRSELPYAVLVFHLLFMFSHHPSIQLRVHDNIFSRILALFPGWIPHHRRQPTSPLRRRDRSETTTRSDVIDLDEVIDVDAVEDDAPRHSVARRLLLLGNQYLVATLYAMSPAQDFTLWKFGATLFVLLGEDGTVTNDTCLFRDELTKLGGRYEPSVRGWLFNGWKAVVNWMKRVNPSDMYTSLRCTTSSATGVVSLLQPCVFNNFVLRNATAAEMNCLPTDQIDHTRGFPMNKYANYRLVLASRGKCGCECDRFKWLAADHRTHLGATGLHGYYSKDCGKWFFAVSVNDARVAMRWLKKYYRGVGMIDSKIQNTIQ